MKKDVYLSKNFKLSELYYSDKAIKYKINNYPPFEVIKRLGALCQNVLQPLREMLNMPIIITSGYRCPELNSKISTARNSQHIYGYAADICVQGMSAKTLYLKIKHSGLQYDQLILEYSKGQEWVHISFVINKNRKQNLIFNKGSYRLDN